EHKIRIINTGQLKPESRTESGVGIENSKERLSYLYGNKATFLLKNYDSEHVLSEIIITH
ncbi:MAG: histidine kinase, partial [Chitinophagaceae bacterium]|nr:histidine kinase [Chitinophagaceae bacterium]